MNDLNGLYEGMSNEEYHAALGLSNTGLTELARSPWHYYSRFLDPSRPEPERKAGQLEGSLAHCAILEPDQIDLRYRVGPNVSRATKEWKALDEIAAAEGLELVKLEDYGRAMKQAESVRRIREVRELFEH